MVNPKEEIVPRRMKIFELAPARELRFLGASSAVDARMITLSNAVRIAAFVQSVKVQVR